MNKHYKKLDDLDISSENWFQSIEDSDGDLIESKECVQWIKSLRQSDLDAIVEMIEKENKELLPKDYDAKMVITCNEWRERYNQACEDIILKIKQLNK